VISRGIVVSNTVGGNFVSSVADYKGFKVSNYIAFELQHYATRAATLLLCARHHRRRARATIVSRATRAVAFAERAVTVARAAQRRRSASHGHASIELGSPSGSQDASASAAPTITAARAVSARTGTLNLISARDSARQRFYWIGH
jgi:hypothetical protein